MSQAAKEAPSKGYAAVRDPELGVGIMDLSSRARILVSGSDAPMFLNGLVTNDVKTLALNSWMPAAFVTVQGRLLAAVRIIHRADGFLIDTEEATRARVFALLQRFTLAGDFKVTDVSDATALLSLQGRAAEQYIRLEFGREAIEIERQEIFRSEKGVDIVPATHTAVEGFDMFMDEALADAFWDSFTLDGIVPVDADTQERLRIEAGIPRYGVDMDESTLVSETNLDDAISFTKGCYVGQEIIVRIKHRGHVAKKLRGLMTESRAPLVVGATVFSKDDKEIGRVTSSTYSPNIDREIALAYIKYDYLTFGTEVKVGTDDREHIVQVTELPLVRGSWYDLIDNTPFPHVSGN
jgi:aminomethyltransferase